MMIEHKKPPAAINIEYVLIYSTRTQTVNKSASFSKYAYQKQCHLAKIDKQASWHSTNSFYTTMNLGCFDETCMKTIDKNILRIGILTYSYNNNMPDLERLLQRREGKNYGI